MCSLHVILFLCFCSVKSNVLLDNNDENLVKVVEKENNIAETKLNMDSLQSVDQLRKVVKTFEDEIKQFNNFYSNRLDHTLANLAITVSSMDANIKNIQERAHVWDTFQLHVSAWNEQIKTLDKKVDIVKGGQEKMMILDGKLGILQSLGYNSQRILNKLLLLEERLENVEKLLKKDDVSPTPLYQEFTARGVLSSLKMLEQKVDRTHVAFGQYLNSKNSRSESIGPNGRKILVQCNTSLVVEDLLKDVSSKVDLMYDKISNPKDDPEDVDEDYTVEIYQNDENEEILKNLKLTPGETKTMRRIWKNFTIPINLKIDDLMSRQNDTIIMLDEIKGSVSNCSDNRENNLDAFMEKVKTGLKENNDLIAKVLQEERVDIIRVEEKIRNFQSDFRDIFSNYLSKNPILPCNNNQDEKEQNQKERASSGPDLETITPDEKSEELMAFKSNSSLDNIIERCKNPRNQIENISCIIFSKIDNASTSQVLCENPAIKAVCDENDYIIFQKRHNGRVSFSRKWDEYRWGFGSLENEEHWLGNEILHLITKKYATSLIIYLTSYEGEEAWASFDRFELESSLENFILRVNGYTGNATDSLSYHNGSPFSSIDRKNDEAPDCCPCSQAFGKGGWWYNSCFESNLNGEYTKNKTEAKGIIWEHWKDQESLAATLMAIKW